MVTAMIRVKLFVVRTADEAQHLLDRFDRSGITARLLDATMLHGDRGRPLFDGRTAGVICQMNNDEHARRIDKAFRTYCVDAIVLDRELRGTLDRPQGRLVVVYRSVDGLQASLVRNWLDEHGVSAVVTGDSLAGSAMGINGPTVTSAVLVSEQDSERARELIAGAEAQRRLAADADEVADDQFDDELEQDAVLAENGWPVCPDCDRRRTTVCPFCDTAGHDFPLADANYAALAEDASSPPLAVICTTCDEPWAAEFYRRCEWCGHDFGHGLAAAREAYSTDEPIEMPGGRVLAVLAGLVGLMVLTLIYFAMIVRS